MTKSVIAAVVALSCVTSGWAQQFDPVKELMSDAEFRAAGLHKLSESELAELNRWLLQYTAQEAAMITETVPEVKKLKNAAIEGTIQGEFQGWRGDTVFRLTNGQVWRQRRDGYYKYSGKQPVDVVIRRNALGFHTLKIVGSNRSVGVKRVE